MKLEIINKPAFKDSLQCLPDSFVSPPLTRFAHNQSMTHPSGQRYRNSRSWFLITTVILTIIIDFMEEDQISYTHN